MRKLTYVFCIYLVVILGCSSPPRRYIPAEPYVSKEKPTFDPDQPQIERGRRLPVIDELGHYVFSLPSKLLLFSWKINNHNISNQTETVIREYIKINKLKNVKVRLNQYAPLEEWKRLLQNKEVGWPWRYTLGVISLIQYTLLPDRLFAGLLGGDSYNPYTNTINLYSDLPVVALHEGGHAKDFSIKEWKGTWAFIGTFPLIDIWQEIIATRDAVRYTYYKRDIELERRAYNILSPALGTYIGADIGVYYGGYWAYLTGVVGGHIVGRIQSYIRGNYESAKAGKTRSPKKPSNKHIKEKE